MTHEAVSSEITISAPADAILDVLTDFESYPEWARSVKDAKVLHSGADGRAETVEFTVTPGPLPRMRYVLRYTYEPSGLAWDYVEGDLRDISGSYELQAADGGTSVTYHLAIDPGTIPLPGFVKARAAREITRVALKELKKRVESG
jgi:uncharacterized membrane protein